MNEKIGFALGAVGETSPHQFRRVLYVSLGDLCEVESLLQIFPHAQITEFRKEMDSLNKFPPGQVCFDIIIFDHTGFSQISLLRQIFKYRYIAIFGKNVFFDPTLLDATFHQIESELRIYKSNTHYFDIFMPIGPSDYSIAAASVLNKYVQIPNVREIFYCASRRLEINATFVSELDYPFSREDAIAAFGLNHERFGWYFQQLKQLYFNVAKPSSLDNYVSMCADLFFNKSFSFFQADVPVYTYGHEHPHEPYFLHMKRLLPQLRCFDGRSAISHHGIFNRQVLLDLFSEVSSCTGKAFWKAFLSSIDPQHRMGSGAAEYEIYFNFLRLKGVNIITREPNYIDTGDFTEGLNADCSYFAYHWHLRKDVVIE